MPPGSSGPRNSNPRSAASCGRGQHFRTADAPAGGRAGALVLVDAGAPGSRHRALFLAAIRAARPDCACTTTRHRTRAASSGAPAHGCDAGADGACRGLGRVCAGQAARRMGACAGAGKADVVGRGARIRRAGRAEGDTRPARHAAGEVDGGSAARGPAVPGARLDRQDDIGAAGRQHRAHARHAHAAGRAGAARRLRLRTPGVVRAARWARLHVDRGRARRERTHAAIGLARLGGRRAAA